MSLSINLDVNAEIMNKEILSVELEKLENLDQIINDALKEAGKRGDIVISTGKIETEQFTATSANISDMSLADKYGDLDEIRDSINNVQYTLDGILPYVTVIHGTGGSQLFQSKIDKILERINDVDWQGRVGVGKDEVKQRVEIIQDQLKVAQYLPPERADAWFKLMYKYLNELMREVGYTEGGGAGGMFTDPATQSYGNREGASQNVKTLVKRVTRGREEKMRDTLFGKLGGEEAGVSKEERMIGGALDVYLKAQSTGVSLKTMLPDIASKKGLVAQALSYAARILIENFKENFPSESELGSSEFVDELIEAMPEMYKGLDNLVLAAYGRYSEHQRRAEYLIEPSLRLQTDTMMMEFENQMIKELKSKNVSESRIGEIMEEWRSREEKFSLEAVRGEEGQVDEFLIKLGDTVVRRVSVLIYDIEKKMLTGSASQRLQEEVGREDLSSLTENLNQLIADAPAEERIILDASLKIRDMMEEIRGGTLDINESYDEFLGLLTIIKGDREKALEALDEVKTQMGMFTG